MKILWHINIPLPEASLKMGMPPLVYGGWLVGLCEYIIKHSSIELDIIFLSPIKHTSFHFNRITYYPITKKEANYPNYLKLIKQVKPDLIHVFGTEFPETLHFIQAFNNPNHTIVQLQGITKFIGELYTYGIPFYIKHLRTFRDLLKCDSIQQQKRLFERRSQIEHEMLMQAKHLIGRTEFDQDFAYSINHEIQYYKVNEILRSPFYEKVWSIDSMKRYRILISQSHYPIKGLHLVIPIFQEIAKQYPMLEIIITGKKPYDDHSLIARLKTSSYGMYLKHLIKKHHLKNHFLFTGELNDIKMRDEMLKSHLFLSSSIIENESNALSEALILGLPAIASHVGGIKSRLFHMENGLCFSLDDLSQLKENIERLFQDDELAVKLSNQSRTLAKLWFNQEINGQQLLNIYQNIKEQDERKNS